MQIIEVGTSDRKKRIWNYLNMGKVQLDWLQKELQPKVKLQMNKYYDEEYLYKDCFLRLIKEYEDMSYTESPEQFNGVILPKDQFQQNQNMPQKYKDYLQSIKENNPYFRMYMWTRGEIYDIQAIFEVWYRITIFE